jgi:hypothetical protein
VPDNCGVTDQVCAQCGRVLDAHDRHVRFRFPSLVLDRSQGGLPEGTWLSHEDPGTSVMMQVPGLGAFVRALLPVRLTGGHTVTYGVWVGIHPDDLQRAFAVWWQPGYTGLTFDGALANTLPPGAYSRLPSASRCETRSRPRTAYTARIRCCPGSWPKLGRIRKSWMPCLKQFRQRDTRQMRASYTCPAPTIAAAISAR